MGRPKHTYEKWLLIAQKEHGDKYKYFQDSWKGFTQKILIECPSHGTFEQKASAHSGGQGCRSCAIENNRISFEEFEIRAELLWGARYSYNAVDYKGYKKKMRIFCKKHQIFFTAIPFYHLIANTERRSAGCSECLRETFRLPFEELVKRADRVQVNSFLISEEDYTRSRESLKVTCLLHGPFIAKSAELFAAGNKWCPECPPPAHKITRSGWSRPEIFIGTILEDLGLIYIKEWTEPTLRGVNNGALRIDFAIHSLKILIEYDGPHNFKPVAYKGNTVKDSLSRFKETLAHDKIKNNWAKKEGWTMIRISYKDNLEETLRSALAHHLKADDK